jgi:hypothetical protein
MRYQGGQGWLALPKGPSEQINTTVMAGHLQAQVL